MPIPRDERQKGLFRPRPDQIADIDRALLRPAGELDWGLLALPFARRARAIRGH